MTSSRISNVGRPGLVVPPANSARVPTAESGRQGPPPTRTDTTTIAAPVRAANIGARALTKANRPAKWPSVGAENVDNSATRSAQQWQPDGTASLSLHEAAAETYEISQEELKVLDELNQRLEQIDRERAELRRSILDRLEKGGEIEPGRLKATRRETDQCRPTLTNLQELFGEEFIRDLRRRLPPIKFVTLRIWEPRTEDSV